MILFSPELALSKYDLEHLDTLIPDPTDHGFAPIENTTYFNREGEKDVVLRPILRWFLKGYSESQAPTTGGPGSRNMAL